MARDAYVYILASKKRGTLYTGVTSNLERRICEHKNHLLEGFTSRYDVTRLVWYVHGNDISAAISLEKKIKNRGRQWKVALIENSNPDWVDPAEGWMDSATPPRSAQNDTEGETAWVISTLP
jgi:putative endonuclease